MRKLQKPACSIGSERRGRPAGDCTDNAQRLGKALRRGYKSRLSE